jgi:hypothetical protein
MMLGKLEQIVKNDLPRFLASTAGWDSLIINRRKPVTHRVFRQIGDMRLCLHHFEKCSPDEAFLHPHPWPAAFLVVDGSYWMDINWSLNRQDAPQLVDPITGGCFSKFLLTRGSCYEISSPLTWHSVTPANDGGVWTVMLNDAPWLPEVAHTQVRTTKGKDLDTMSENELALFLMNFEDRFSGLR